VSTTRPRLSIVVPACDAERTLVEALTAILASHLPRNVYELIVVDDASRDASASIAARYADKVIRLTGNRLGAAYARNRGVDFSEGEIVAFVDADVAVRPDTLPRMLSMLAEHPTIGAVSASHDAGHGSANLVSQYWNLLLRFGETRHAGDCADIPSGCAALRRSALLTTGMFDEWRFPTASLEGLELAQRLHASGFRLVLSPDIEVTQLRRWSLRSVVREVWTRSALLARSLGYLRTSETAPSEVVFTLSRSLVPVVGFVGASTLVAAFFPESHIVVSGAAALAALGVVNFPAYSFFAKARGLPFALIAAPLHLSMQAVSAVALCVGWILRDAIGDRLPDATTQAYAELGLETWPPIPRPR